MKLLPKITIFLGFLTFFLAPPVFAKRIKKGNHVGGHFALLIRGVQINKGLVSVLFFKTQDGFPTEKAKAFSHFDIYPQLREDGTLLFDLSDVEPDDYGIIVYQDINHNGTLDPTEPFSNGNNMQSTDFNRSVVIYNGRRILLDLSIKKANISSAPLNIDTNEMNKTKGNNGKNKPLPLRIPSQNKELFIEQSIKKQQTGPSAQHFLNDLYRYVNRTHMFKWYPKIPTGKKKSPQHKDYHLTAQSMD